MQDQVFGLMRNQKDGDADFIALERATTLRLRRSTARLRWYRCRRQRPRHVAPRMACRRKPWCVLEGKALLRPNDMDNALIDVAGANII